MYHFLKKICASFYVCALLGGCFLSGCKTLSLPAIDPTGNRIFSDQGTTINPIHGSPNDGYPSQQPAYQTPPNPPQCVQEGKGSKLCQGCLSGKGCLARRKEAEEIRGRCGQLLLTPTRIVAPVGGEVVLLAGVCGKDEYLVTNEPIEWMLSPRSVGEIVEVGDDAKGQRRTGWKRDEGPKVEKLDVDFARGRTSREAGMITKGTSDRSDDLPIRKGQTWISVTSAHEGVSKLTALAPDSDVWDKRRQTATIYWIDAEWSFPAEQFAKSGETVRLVTRVTQAEGFVPAVGWKVRYRTLNPEFAKFLNRNGQPGAEIDEDTLEVDQNGNAVVEIVHGTISPFGTALIEIEIIKPKLGAEMPELQIAKGTTSVTWSAPSLILDAIGPDEGVPGQPLAYFASLANVGDLVAENAMLKVTIPNGMTLESPVRPDPQSTNSEISWTIGPIEPRRKVEIPFTLIASTSMDARVKIDGIATPNLAQTKTISTYIQNPKLTLDIAPTQNRTQVEVGDEAAFDIRLTNSGNQTINNLDIILKSDPGLTHIKGGNEATQRVEFLTPGQSIVLAAAFIVRSEGDSAVNVIAQSASQVLATGKSGVRGIPATPKQPSIDLQVLQKSVQDSVPLGGELTFSWRVSNTGPIPLRNVVLSLQHSIELEMVALSQGYEYSRERQLARWTINEILPGANLQFEGKMIGATVSQRADISLQVDTANGLRKNQLISVGIGNAPPGAGGFGGAANKPAIPEFEQGKQLLVSIVPVSNAIKQGEIGTYEIRVESLRNKPHQQVALEVRFPKSCTLTSVEAKALKHNLVGAERAIVFEPIKYFRGNDVFSAVIRLKIDATAVDEIVAQVSSLGQPDPSVARLAVQAAN